MCVDDEHAPGSLARAARSQAAGPFRSFPAMRVWITGGSGFVGARLAARLRADGEEVFTSDMDVDVSDATAVAHKVRELAPDAIVHLAAITFVPAAAADPLGAFRVNYLGTHSVLEALRTVAPSARALLVSSSVIYGSVEPGQQPFTEASALSPQGAYATTKAAADMLGAHYAGLGLDVLRVRPFNHTGPGRPVSFVESSFARQLAEMERGEREPVMQVGNLDAVRDFLHVDDVVDAYARLLRPEVPAGTYNIASGAGTRIGDLLDTLVARSSAKPTIEVDPALWREAGANVGDASLLHETTGWSPRHALGDTLGALLEDWRTRTRPQRGTP